MKKLIAIALGAFFGFGIVSCGHGDCDAYHKADYSKYKIEKQHDQEVLSILKSRVK